MASPVQGAVLLRRFRTKPVPEQQFRERFDAPARLRRRAGCSLCFLKGKVMGNYLLGLLMIAASLFFAAWQEYRARNPRDGGLMAGMGALIVAGGAALSFLV